jgi:NAD(P)-dependent dehydrogenase (short-subunit alcohol dehydrogenase family)
VNKNKQVLIGGMVTILAGIGVYRIVSTQRNRKPALGDNWTTAKIPDLTGRVIVVTGANSGIGLEAAKEFTRKRAQAILACRNLDKAQAALDQIQAEIPSATAEIMHLDLANQASIRSFTAEFKAKHDRLDVLVNNAGIMISPYSRTDDGFESQFGTNHLGHFALTGLLLDLLLETPGARVVTVSSMGHRFGSIDFEDLMHDGGNGYSTFRAYGRSKLANLLFTYELQRHFEAIDADAIAVAAHPGTSSTYVDRYLNDRLYFKLLRRFKPAITQSAVMGALPTVRAATDPDVEGGQYFGPSGFMERKGPPTIVQSSGASHDQAVARQLWQVSEQLTGVRYDGV